MSTTIDPQRSLGELVLEHPGLAPTFEQLGLDYCCGGKASLAEAAAERGLDSRTLAIALEAGSRADDAASGERDWRQASFAELCDHIVDRHHAFLRRELPRIEELLGKVVDRHGATDSSLASMQSEFATLHADLITHIDSEEQALFPICRELGEGDELGAGALPQLAAHEAAHTGVGEALARLRALGGDYDTEAAHCTTHRVLLESLLELELDLHQHVHEENNVLFARLRGELGEPRPPVPA